MHYKFHKINPNHVGSYIDNKQKPTINTINKYDVKGFQYTRRVASNQSGKNDRKKIEKNSPAIGVDVLILKLKNISSLHSKHNSKCERQVILLENKKKRK